ncbi:hypothetical protein SASPL_122221 [Salvia splendens]|uniref:Uncharacterized protein n=1 Tax=Salvia splendens TaxID=180675 RepID=A0A8X8XL66_SALSN|nr:hypothetical protein SASPL_122221 [Salvia splendens]
MEIDLFDNQSYTKTHNFIRWKSGKMIDSKLLALLESFGEIYIRRREFFKKIFDETYEELFEMVGKALMNTKKMKNTRSLRRSMSMRAIGTRGIDEEELRLERFKVKTPDVIVVEQDGPTQTTKDSSSD